MNPHSFPSSLNALRKVAFRSIRSPKEVPRGGKLPPVEPESPRMLILPKPSCAKCQAPVERLTAKWANGDLYVTAYCHGAEEIAKIPKEDLIEALNVSAGVAFKEPECQKSA